MFSRPTSVSSAKEIEIINEKQNMVIIKQLMDRIYRNVPLEDIPWIIENPPDVLVELVESGKVKPCKLYFHGEENSNRMIMQSFSTKAIFRKKLVKMEKSSSTSVFKSFDMK